MTFHKGTFIIFSLTMTLSFPPPLLLPPKMYPSIFLSFGGLGFYQFICCSLLHSTLTQFDEEIKTSTSSLPLCQGRPALQPLSELQSTLKVQLRKMVGNI